MKKKSNNSAETVTSLSFAGLNFNFLKNHNLNKQSPKLLEAHIKYSLIFLFLFLYFLRPPPLAPSPVRVHLPICLNKT